MGKHLTPSGEVLLEEHDLPGTVLPEGQSPGMIFLPACDVSHIPGCLDLVASLAEDLEIIPGPLVTFHGDWPDVVQNVVMKGIRTCSGVGFTDFLFAPGTLPFLLIPDKPPHSGDRGPLFIPILYTAGGLAAQGSFVSGIEVCSLTATIGTGPPGEAILLFRSRTAVFTHYHVRVSPLGPNRYHGAHSGPGPDNAGAGAGESVPRTAGVR